MWPTSYFLSELSVQSQSAFSNLSLPDSTVGKFKPFTFSYQTFNAVLLYGSQKQIRLLK